VGDALAVAGRAWWLWEWLEMGILLGQTFQLDSSSYVTYRNTYTQECLVAAKAHSIHTVNITRFGKDYIFEIKKIILPWVYKLNKELNIRGKIRDVSHLPTMKYIFYPMLRYK